MSHYITTHDAAGAAVWFRDVAKESPEVPIAMGTVKIVSSTYSFPLDLSTEADIDNFTRDRSNAAFPGTRQMCPDTGTAVVIITMPPGAATPLHRTMTMDVIYIIQGVVEMTLDSGESRILRSGDSMVQRGTMHGWNNVSLNGEKARIIIFTQPIQEPLEIGGKKLSQEWVHA